MEAETDPSTLLERLHTLEESVSELESQLESLLETDLVDHLADLAPLEGAKLNATLAYAIATILFVYLRTNGLNPKEHPVKAELDGIKKYFLKIATAEGSYKPNFKLDKDAAKRFVKAALKEVGATTVEDTE
jgi:exosome complex protein LRP1